MTHISPLLGLQKKTTWSELKKTEFTQCKLFMFSLLMSPQYRIDFVYLCITAQIFTSHFTFALKCSNSVQPRFKINIYKRSQTISTTTTATAVVLSAHLLISLPPSRTHILRLHCSTSVIIIITIITGFLPLRLFEQCNRSPSSLFARSVPSLAVSKFYFCNKKLYSMLCEHLHV